MFDTASPPRILMACANDWNSPLQVGDHHLARLFAEAGWKVAFVSAPLSPWHFLKTDRKEVFRRFEVWHKGGKWASKNIFHYVPLTALAPHPAFLFRSRMVLKDWFRWTWPKVTRVLQQAGFDAVDLLYIRDLRQFFWVDALPHRRLVFRLADRDEAFSHFTEALREAEKKIFSRADLVLCTTLALQRYAEERGAKKTLFFPNGVHFEHFTKKKELPLEYRNIASPRAVYAGSFGSWVNLSLIQTAAKALPGVQFVLIGPKGPALSSWEVLPNLHYLGPKPYSELPAYLQNAHVGLLPFDVEKEGLLVHDVHPLKLYEYLASGLPVAAVRWKAIEKMPPPVFLGESAKGFLGAIQKALRAGSNLRKKGKLLAGREDWSRRFQRLMRVLEREVKR